MSSYQPSNRIRLLNLASIAAILVLWTGIVVWWWAPSHFVIPGVSGYGELFEAFHAARNIQMFGWKWAGLQDMATNPDPASHPFLYVHHVNFGTFFSLVMHKLGFASVETQNMLSGLGSMAGLFLASLLIGRLSGSALIASVFLVLLAFDLHFMTNWAFNIHRAFSYFSFAGTIYAFVRVSWPNPPRAHLLLFIAFCATLIGADYIYYIFTLITLVLYVVLTSRGAFKEASRPLGLICGVFALLFVARQMQVILGLGFDKWVLDFLYQILNRLHLEYLYPGDWSLATTRFYADGRILNPGFAPLVTWNERISSFLSSTGVALTRDVLNLSVSGEKRIRFIGAVFVLIFLLSAILAILPSNSGRWPVALARHVISLALAYGLVVGLSFGVAHSWVPRDLPILRVILATVLALVIFLFIKIPSPVSHKKPCEAVPLRNFSIALFLACAVMYGVFPTYFKQWYSEFQLNVFVTFVWVTFLLEPVGRVLEREGYGTRVVLLLLALRVIAIAPEFYHGSKAIGDHAIALRALRGQTVATNFTPASVASYTNAFSGWIRPSSIRALLETAEISPADYAMIFERDVDNPAFRRPQYLFLFRPYLDPRQMLELERSGRFPVAQGQSYMLYSVNDR